MGFVAMVPISILGVAVLVVVHLHQGVGIHAHALEAMIKKTFAFIVLHLPHN